MEEEAVQAQSNFQNFITIANPNEINVSLHVDSWSGLPSGADNMLSWSPEGKAGHKFDT